MIGFIAPFQILDHLDCLKVVKETNREYHCLCPVCEDGGFKVNKKNGSYKAFKCGCEVKDIREAIRPWSEAKEQGRQGAGATKSRGARETARLAQLALPAKDSPTPEKKEIAPWLQKQGIPSQALETRYWYSKTQWVSRFEWKNNDGTSEKTIRQGHIKSNGLVEWKKGGKDWRAYKLGEATKYCADKWVLGVEGEGCVESARTRAIAAITWQGSNWEISRIVKDLTKLIEASAAGLIYFPDNDETGAKKAKLIKSACQQCNFPCLILSPIDVWSEMPVKGDITDWVNVHQDLSQKQLTAKLDSAIAIAKLAEGIANKRNEQEIRDRTEQEELASLPNWSQSDIALWLANKYKGQLAWNTDSQEWYRYSAVKTGIWSIEPVEFIGQLVNSELEELAELIGYGSKNKKKPSYTISMINGAIALLKMKLAIRKWNEAEGLLPMLNGVLDLETRKLLPHSPGNRLTWCLPYEYNFFATCEPIQEWLLTMCGGDRSLVQLMRAYLLGIVTSRTDWQKFIELIGPGGTGKSTFTRVAKALVGEENVHTTTLHKLEKSKFEPASIFGKRLVVVNDSERYAGNVDKLKNLTGQDSLPYEVKFKQSKGGFDPCAMVIVSTNEVIQSTDYTSGLGRRRISIPMDNQISGTQQKNLIEHKNGQLHGEFVPYIPGLLNWVLEMDEESATEIVKDYEAHVPSLLAMKARTLVETNPIADWLDNFVVYDPKARTNVGVAKRDKDSNSATWFLNTDVWLYANYKEYCQNSGTKAVSLRRFVNLLSDLGQNQLGLDIKRERDRTGSYFVGLKLRDVNDDSPPLITNNIEVVINTEPQLENTNVINRLWTMVMDKVTDVMECVMDETVDSDEFDNCDGKNENSLETKSNVEGEANCSTKNDDSLESQKTLEEVSRMPSHPSRDKTPTQTEPGNDYNHSAITVGDFVTVDDCPGHWDWVSPFKVEAIEVDLVRLEMVDQPIEISRLQKCLKKD